MVVHGKIERVKESNLFTQYQQRLKTVPHKYWIIGGVLLSLVLVYSLLFFIPKKVEFSYAGETCVSQLSLFPSAQTRSSESFDITLKDEAKIGNWTYATTKACITPKTAPKEGSYTASVGLLGGWFAAKRLAIEVESPPVVLANTVVGTAISPALPLKVKLTGTDTVHQYTLSMANKQAACESDAEYIVCPVTDLKLSSGADYDMSISRSFNGDNTTDVAKGEVATLIPIVLGETTVKEAQTLYDMPKEFAFSFDQPVKEANVTLKQKDGDTYKDIKTTTRADGTILSVVMANDLPRKAEFSLTLNQVIAEKGNSLESPVTINFATSGGPKPNNVSVGASGVAQSAQIIVSLDQPIKEGVDITQFAQIAGVNGGVVQRSATELVFTINGGLCQAFSLSLKEGIASGSNNELSEAWKFDSRIVCGTSSVIGYSVQGRPIIAYYFGNGSNTILFTGGIHGSERSGQQTMQAFVDHLMQNGTAIPDNRRLVVVPNTNPDAIARGSRNNVNNVNVDRNFPASNWAADIDTASGRLVNGGGTAPGSEPEAKALINLTRQLKPRLSISYHAQGRLVGANQVSISVNAGNVYASTVGYGTMYGNAEEVMGYPITGEYEDWMGEEMGIAAILIELPTPNGNYLSSQLAAIRKMLVL